MKESIIVTYPNFGALPKAIKQLLLTSESFFFEDLRARPMGRANRNLTITFTVPKAKVTMPSRHRWSMN